MPQSDTTGPKLPLKDTARIRKVGERQAEQREGGRDNKKKTGIKSGMKKMELDSEEREEEGGK